MTFHQSLEHRVRALLGNHELKVVLDSPEDDYRFEYYTTIVKDRKSGNGRHVRTYRLIDLRKGGATPEPWDVYDIEKQTGLVTNLIDVGRYRISRIVAGWTIKCPSCGKVMQGKIWDAVPKTCSGHGSQKCRQKLDDSLVEEIVIDDKA